ncbi:Alpha/Beta hydrolase protein [Halteromyces radiatus]|uniref:Alpha/Beta hydrolase protein n=1 Tax=Halteromyces radiatus TaxID=101107 RepID=UPI00222127A9|nr:Alpha/Beta hydrolase protein [Halteromyces radiatus]KAI8077811.1 Alpha/Beta hydrolase protein [Halteromyces radiatus]
MVENKPYGSWPSPITAESLASGKVATDICIDPTTQSVYWCEVIPSEEGRGQIFRQRLDSNDKPEPLLALGYDCRSRVHEYGGGSFIVSNGLLVFSNDKDFALYSLNLTDSHAQPQRVTESNKLIRYGDFCLDAKHDFVIAIQEEHFENEEPKDVVNTLVAVQLSTGKVKVLAQGCDFYCSPRISDDGSALTFVSWVHPNMPWDYTQLSYATFHYSDQDSVVLDSVILVNPDIEESIVQPEFGVDNTLYFASDRSGFWNLYRYQVNTNQVELLLESPLNQEFAGAQWSLCTYWYSPFKSDPTKLACLNKESLAILDTTSKTLTNLPSNYDHFSQIRTFINGDHQEVIVVNASATTVPIDLIAYDVSSQAIQRVLKPSTVPKMDPAYISVGREIAFPTTNGQTAYCYYYEPRNPKYTSDDNCPPPLRVLSHGGPTTSTTNEYRSVIQYWTTRGFAIADVNYGGSTGYGRDYRNRLKKKWGIVDVDDCCNAALYLAEQGWVDRNKLAIEGGSAGGFTTLASLAFRNVFKAGVCKYGISDITLLAKETHKFESRYTDRLIGEYPKEKHIYQERSPLFAADEINCPVIFFQGKDDKVVPPGQSEIMVNALQKKGVPVAYVLYDGEGHGFRRAENIKRTMELEQWFLGQTFGFEVDGVEGVPIDNFPPK